MLTTKDIENFKGTLDCINTIMRTFKEKEN